jgi:signal transduction histidine kinase
MTAGEVLLARARPWLAGRRPELMRVAAPLPGVAMAWWLTAVGLSPTVWGALVAYSLVHLAVYAAGWRESARGTAFGRPSQSWLRVTADVALGLLLVTQSPTLGATFFPLYLLIALRVLAGYPRAPFATVTPFLLGPVYLFAGTIAGHQPPLTLAEQLSSWGVLLGSLGFGAVAIWMSAARQRESSVLRQLLRAERQNREARVEELERITNELRSRMRERHALEEGLRVITSTLSLDEVLTQIVDSTVHTFGQERIHAMALSLELDGVMKHHAFTADGRGECPWAEPLARRVIVQQVPVIAADAALDAEMSPLAVHGMRSVLSVPLFVGDGPPRGALTVVSATFAAFSSSDARHLAAFAAQAGIAIGNAELHSRLHNQQRLLEAVMRDINDGLVVLDDAGRVVLANPIGQWLLEGASAARPVADQLAELAAGLRGDSGRSSAASELKVHTGEDEDSERYYQAFASAVHRDDSTEPLAAIVLHDITNQKAEERARVEFISMVSHELRNPLHSLNGFVKVVLQGRAGELNALQQDFLQMADSQIEQLKGRIAELLEFNRLKAGRLSLNPQWSDLTLLVNGTVNRLSLQAEERGLTLVNNLSRELPECWCDSARIGQVLTNLIENAIKATPSGGSITVSSEIHDNDVWVRVRDTGVGIPAGELGKIFQRFYRVAKHTNGPDNHLGLGLAICQQIVEGHGGRMWVESQEGVGTCFTFALPLARHSEFVPS